VGETGAERRSRLLSAAVGGSLATGAWLALGEAGLLGSLGLEVLPTLPFAAAAGALLGLLRSEWLVWCLFAPACAVLVLVGATGVMRGPIQRLVRRDSLPAHADAVVVLAGALTRDGRIGETALARLACGLVPIRSGVSSELVLTRLEKRYGGRTVRSDADQSSLVPRLVPEAHLSLVGPVHNTRGEALAVADLARVKGWRSVVVVTSPLHSRRACATFERVGLTVACRPSEERRFAVESLPSPGDRIVGFGEWVYEALGWVVYRRRGWVR
jgi:uncharacterized SAM-binding protein YcdF (DUF218 family)